MSSKEPESNKTDETKSSSSAGTSSSSTKTIVTNLASIIRALEEAEENDNRKIALLLILCELIKSGKLSNQLGRENEERLFNSIGAHFLARLLVTRQKAPSDSCSPFIYKSLCLSILTQFCSRPDLIQDPLILTRLSAFFDILKIPVNETASSDEERSLLTNLKLDTYKYLFAVAHINWEYLCNNGLFDLLFNSVILNETESTEYKLMGNNFDDESNETNFALVACKLVEVVFKSRSAQMAVSKMSQEKQQQFEQLPHRFAVNFAMFLSKADSAKAKFKFQLVNYVNYFLSSKTITESIVANADLSEETSTRVYSILSELFKSKHEIQLAFFLLKNFIDLFQFEYIYMKDRKFFYFVIHLLCIQTALNLENAASSGVTTKLDEVDFNLMTIYYQLLEDVIIILSTASPFDDGDEDEEEYEESEDDDEDEDDDDDESDDRFMGKKHTSEKPKSSNKPEQKNEPEFENVIKIVVELLESVIIYLKDELVSTNGRDNKPIDKLDVRSICLISSSIRLLMCWLSHESLLEKEILDLMPRFLYFAEQIHNKDSSNDEQQINLYNFLSAGLQKIYLNLSVKKDLKKTTKKNDLVKREFETVELDEEMQRVKNMMDTCYVNMNETQSVAKN